MSEWRQRTVAENQASNAAADVEMSQYVADRTRVNEDKIKQDDEIIEQFGDYNYGWHDTDFAGEAAKKGIDENVVRAISADKHEPEWMLEKRLEGYRDFIDRPMPQWGVDLKDFDADDFKYYVKPIDKQATTWEELPDEIRSTYDKLGIPEAEKSRLVSGVAAQYESEVIFNSIEKDLEEQGVISRRVALLDRKEVGPRELALVELLLERETLALRGDRFILRDAGAQRTVAGGAGPRYRPADPAQAHARAARPAGADAQR